jgi:hypothetical protein
MQTYHYEFSGTAADGQTWTAKGSFSVMTESITEAIDIAHGFAFGKLTKGKAVYGLPGVGCNGPYTITHIDIRKDTTP